MRTKRVISFSIWGDNEGYAQGAVENAKRAPKFYPGWVCRFYVDPKVPSHIIDTLRGMGSEIYEEPVSEDWQGLYWRFKPMYDDPTIERFIVRDTDSRLNGREADAVQEWIDSGLLFHCMRDNPAHCVAIMGAMWGSVAGIIPDFRLLMDDWCANLQPNPENPKGLLHGSDQVFLERVIWPRVKGSCMSHDEYFTYTGDERPFRVKLQRGGYVGMIYMDHEADRCEVQE